MQKTLLTCLWYEYVFFNLSAQSVTASLPYLSPKTNLFAQPTNNFSILFPDLRDNNFGCPTQYSNASLSATTCMTLRIFAMRDLTLRDFESNVDEKTWSMYSYLEAKVSFTSNTGDIGTVHGAMSSLAAVNRNMTVRSRFFPAYADMILSTDFVLYRLARVNKGCLIG